MVRMAVDAGRVVEVGRVAVAPRSLRASVSTKPEGWGIVLVAMGLPSIIGLAWRLYQQNLAWSVGTDSSTDEFARVWKSVVYLNLVGLMVGAAVLVISIMLVGILLPCLIGITIYVVLQVRKLSKVEVPEDATRDLDTPAERTEREEINRLGG